MLKTKLFAAMALWLPLALAACSTSGGAQDPSTQDTTADLTCDDGNCNTDILEGDSTLDSTATGDTKDDQVGADLDDQVSADLGEDTGETLVVEDTLTELVEPPCTDNSDCNEGETCDPVLGCVVEGTGPCCAIVDTNQTQCFALDNCVTCPEEGAALSGQDASYVGVPFSFQDNGDDTVTDLNTGLMWQKTPGYMSFDEAVAAAEVSTHAGYDDWRLPTLKELYSLMDFNGLDPSGCDGVTDCALVPFIDSTMFNFEYGNESLGARLIDAQYATSTLYVATTMEDAETMFGVNFADGRIKGYGTGPMMGQGEDKSFNVLFVRGHTKYGVNDFADNGDGTVSDASTGLMWTKGDSGTLGAGTMNWEGALDWCENLEHAGYADWRLPNAKELQGIVDYTRSPATSNSAAIDPVFEATSIIDEGGATNWAFYWTSTTHKSVGNGTVHGNYAIYVAFGEALGFMPDLTGSNVELMDVHGAGAQRSDPKIGNASDYPTGNGPQGDVVRIDNMVRCVRGGVDAFEAGAICQPTPAPVTCDIAEEGESCCGDGTCDLIESTSNCPDDCTGTQTEPTPCDTQADCELADACPQEATLGCVCAETPSGSACIPACEEDSDCPPVPGLVLTCSMDGVCVPSGGPGR